MGEYAPNGGIFTGNLWLDRYENGVLTGERDVGNARLFTLGTPTIEQKEKPSKRLESFGGTLETILLKNARKLKISMDDIAGVFKENLVISMFGTDSVVTEAGGAVTGEAFTAHLDKGYALAKNKVKASPAPVVEAVTPDEWEDLTLYALGDFVEPATPNGFRYECTTAGTSGSTEPTWGATPVVGGTVSDGSTLVWTCRKLTYTVDVDYEVSTTGPTTYIIPLSTGAIEEGQELEVGYSNDAYAGYEITADTATQIDVFARLIGSNLNNGDDVEVKVFKARLKPISALNFIVDDFVALELEGEVLVTNNGTWKVRVLEAA